jgi:hypothetical protein
VGGLLCIYAKLNLLQVTAAGRKGFLREAASIFLSHCKVREGLLKVSTWVAEQEAAHQSGSTFYSLQASRVT